MFATIENSGFGIFEQQSGRWTFKKLFDEHPNLSNPTADDSGNIWLNDNGSRILKLTLNQSCDSIARMIVMAASPEIPLKQANVFKFNNSIKIGTDIGVFEITGNTLIPSKALNKVLGENFHIHSVKLDRNQNTWFHGTRNKQDAIGKIRINGLGKTEVALFETPLKRISDYLLFVFYPINDENIIFDSSEKIILYNTTKSDVCNDSFHVLLRSVETIKPVDSVLFGGTWLKEGKPTGFQTPEMVPVLSFGNNALRFRFSGIFL